MTITQCLICISRVWLETTRSMKLSSRFSDGRYVLTARCITTGVAEDRNTFSLPWLTKKHITAIPSGRPLSRHVCEVKGENNALSTTVPRHILNSQYRMHCEFSYKARFSIWNSALWKRQTPWHESTSELFRPSDRCLSVNLVPTFADRGVSRGQRNGISRP
jgi:hypothetical protein